MDTQQPQPLRPGDTLTREEGEALIRERMTDEMAQEMGYPSKKVWWMERELEDLAAQWRGTKADQLIKDYHLLFYKLIAFGWDPRSIPFEAELPRDLMPELPEKVADA
jgi:hypothetical protein